ncbi:F0F1 ATP synthase subunit A [Gimesia sp.]|uniref:F0F1 ATP synthase subunit A n=1 Tax=Gimesia sp. TaxID=2024833 RepID=UPI000C651353|nr:F0F1 ATP synthase subunit A [Gimesia sp.]MAX36526.1 ATP synthase F0 subunit A [Gimesia sp.]HAH46278.1 ATP synthase F0 subunit A [Planctomycetaceae bacterium]HBL46584.1 ATP synthase F0 subunit A [Planctomycetaceae bacterium]|tara:strand:- start:44032 stop:44892 length:861 start_codon:yes stop_codon:yes gene_type:complete
MAAGHSDNFHHVRDFGHFELPGQYHLDLPVIFGLQITKFMVLQLVAVVFLFLVFRGLAKRAAGGQVVQGRWWNFWESIVLYMRDEVVRPTIGYGHHDDHGHGHHDHTPKVGHPADKYLPFVLSCFFYVLICNLLGVFPWMGSATGELNVTIALAFTTFCAVVFYGSREQGPVQFWLSLAPPMELPFFLKIILVPMLWVIELAGFLIKHAVLAIRLFANIMAGHTVIAVFLGFIALTAESGMWAIVMPSSILAQVLIGLLELFVAFLQAYVFAFLATLFIGAAVNPH